MHQVYFGSLLLSAARPAVIVPLMGRTEKELTGRLPAIRDCAPDAVEWRIDTFASAFSGGTAEADRILAAARSIRSALGKMPLLATLRSAAEGGCLDLPAEVCRRLQLDLIFSGCADAVDVEVFSGGPAAEDHIRACQKAGAPVVGSWHNFDFTPDKEELVCRFRRILEAGADVAKIAVMPSGRSDVLSLLHAAEDILQEFPDALLTAVAMGEAGVSSRICPALFGSCLTFGTAGEASAPGQLPVSVLRTVIGGPESR